MSGWKKDETKEGVSEKLFQQAILYFINHPDRWIRRKEIQEALEIGKTQACRLFQALAFVGCFESNENDNKADNSPIEYKLNSEKIKRAEAELAQISTLSNEDRIILTILMDMADSTGLYGELIGNLKKHLSLSRFAEKGIIPMVSYSPDMQTGGDGRKFIPQILQAIDQIKSARITYKNPWAEKESTYTINPIGLFSQNDILYLFSYNPYYKKTIVHALSRVKNIVPDKEAYTPEKFKDLSLVMDPFGIATDEKPITVSVWIDPEQAIFEKEAARTKNAELTENQDGSLVLTIQTRNRYACKKWILSLGIQAKCLTPPDLVEEIKDELRILINNYEIKNY